LELEKDLNPDQKQRALYIMKENLSHHDDWIVLCQTMVTLDKWAKEDDALKIWLLPHLRRLAEDSRKAVAKKAAKTSDVLGR